MEQIAAYCKLCFGGAFNPIHHGHLISARAAAEALGIRSVVLLPYHESPHKKLHPNAPKEMPDSSGAQSLAEHRLTMCRLAVAGFDKLTAGGFKNPTAGGFGGFEVDDRELRRPGPTYTIDTVRELKQAGWQRVPWLLGADQVVKLHTWHQPQQLLHEAWLVVLERPGIELDWLKLPPEFRVLAERVVPAPAIDISSTDIRRRVARGDSIDFLTPPAVCEYISEHGLYRGLHSEG